MKYKKNLIKSYIFTENKLKPKTDQNLWNLFWRNVSTKKRTQIKDWYLFSWGAHRTRNFSEILIKTTPNYAVVRRINERPSGRSCEDNWWQEVRKTLGEVFFFVFIFSSFLLLNFSIQGSFILLPRDKFIRHINPTPGYRKAAELILPWSFFCFD